jgi:hypothetical protein
LIWRRSFDTFENATLQAARMPAEVHSTPA